MVTIYIVWLEVMKILNRITPNYFGILLYLRRSEELRSFYINSSLIINYFIEVIKYLSNRKYYERMIGWSNLSFVSTHLW